MDADASSLVLGLQSAFEQGGSWAGAPFFNVWPSVSMQSPVIIPSLNGWDVCYGMDG